MILDLNDYDLVKAITRNEAKAVHKDLPPGGVWRTVKGHHIYIVGNDVVAGSVPGVTKAKKATKAHMKEHQAHIDKEAKKKGAGTHATTKTAGTKPKATPKGKQPVSNDRPKPSGNATSKGKPKSTKGKTSLVIQPDKPKVEPKKAPSKLEMSKDGLVLYHGTKLRNVESIMEHGFDLNGSEDDFGDAVYFKSPAYDHLDHKDFADWRDERLSTGKPVPAKYMDKRGEDTVSIVESFTGKYDGAVMKALVAQEHVLDCSSGRPEELQSLIDEYASNTKPEQRIRLAFRHILGESMDDKSEEEMHDIYGDRKEELANKWGGSKMFMAGKISPYEVYAKKHGIGAIVDKLDHYKDEGWQIGVYNPKLISVSDHGKSLAYNDGVSLMKALMKALQKGSNAGHCLVHHEMTDKGLVLHIGAYRAKGRMEKSLDDFRSAIASWRGGAS